MSSRCLPWCRGRATVHTPPVDILSELFLALPDRLEIKVPDGAVYCNRAGPRPHALVLASSITLPCGAAVTVWKEDELLVSLNSLPALAWIAEPSDKGSNGGWSRRVNKPWTEFYRVPPDDWFSTIHPDDAARFASMWQEASATGSRFQCDKRTRRAEDGQYVWFRMCAEPLHNAQGGFLGYLCLQTDIQALKDAETRANDERQRLVQILDHLPVGVLVAEAPSGKAILANRSCRESAGPATPFFENMQSFDRYPTARCIRSDGRPYEEGDWPMARSIQLEETTINEEMKFLRSDGTYTLLRVNSSPVYSSTGSLFGGVTVFEDITALHAQAEERMKLLAAERAAIEASHIKSTFVANMSHELRTPVHGIIGLAELLFQSLTSHAAGGSVDSPIAVPRLAHGDASEQHTHSDDMEYRQAILDSAKLLQSLISDVLDFSKVEAGRMQLEALPLQLPALVQHTLVLLAGTAEEKQATLDFEADPSIPPVLLGDPVRLQQILLNLVSNALKFAGGPGRPGVVHVRLRVCDASTVSESTLTPGPAEAKNLYNGASAAGTSPRPSAESQQRQLQKRQPSQQQLLPVQSSGLPPVTVSIEVSDNGPGVPSEVAGRLFAPFMQADSSTTRRFGGTGLGLSICRGLTTLMGGNIGVDSPNDLGGATFWCRVPLQLPPASPMSIVRSMSRSSSDVSALAIQIPPELVGDAVAPDGVLRSPLALLPSPRNARILIVEDNRVNRLIAERLVLQLGHRPELAHNGEVGLRMVTDAPAPYDVILMDCQMPLMDGFDCTRAIRALPDPAKARVPIIALSASSQQGDIERCHECGMNDHLSKPVDLMSIKRCIQHWLAAGSIVAPEPAE